MQHFVLLELKIVFLIKGFRPFIISLKSMKKLKYIFTIKI